MYSVSISGYYPTSCSSKPGHDARLGSTPILLKLWFEWGYYQASLPHGRDTLIPRTHRKAGSFMVGRYFTPDPGNGMTYITYMTSMTCMTCMTSSVKCQGLNLTLLLYYIARHCLSILSNANQMFVFLCFQLYSLKSWNLNVTNSVFYFTVGF